MVEKGSREPRAVAGSAVEDGIEQALFASLSASASGPPMPQTLPIADRTAQVSAREFAPTVDERFLEVYRRARDPSNPLELRDLYVGRVETELGAAALRPELAELWRSTRPRRLYGALRSDGQAFGLPEALKECIRYALARDWYGYSDSRGRDPAREAIAWYESARSGGLRYDVENVALTLGGLRAAFSAAASRRLCGFAAETTYTRPGKG